MSDARSRTLSDVVKDLRWAVEEDHATGGNTPLADSVEILLDEIERLRTERDEWMRVAGRYRSEIDRCDRTEVHANARR